MFSPIRPINSARTSASVWPEYGKADTDGRELSTTSVITVDRRGIEHFRLRRTKSRKVVQHSIPVLQGWRANSDVQLMLYRSHPDKPDISEIENVCKYVVAYASKKNHTTKEEKEAIQNIIQRCVIIWYCIIECFWTGCKFIQTQMINPTNHSCQLNFFESGANLFKRPTLH